MSQPLVYKHPSSLINTQRFDFTGSSAATPYGVFGTDPVVIEARSAENPLLETARLAQSPNWEDRIRAEALLRTSQITQVHMPPQFPCIREVTDSRQNVWVASANLDMLTELLPLYQGLWDAYMDQWPTSEKRQFIIAHSDDVPAYTVYREGATVRDVIAQTLLTHTDIYSMVPPFYQQMHPRHEDWNTA